MKKEPLGTVEKRKKFSRKTWKIMKLCGIFCFVLSLNLSANVYSQQNKVSLDLKEVTLEEFIFEGSHLGGIYRGGEATDGSELPVQCLAVRGGGQSERQGKERAVVQGAGRNAGTKRLCY